MTHTFTLTTREIAFQMIDTERKCQEKMAKEDIHDDKTWLTIAIDYLGRTAKYIWRGESIETPVVKVAAVLVAWLEDRLEDARE